MPSKKKKYNARFPAGRIKKIMQTDEEVGKVAQAVPVIISRTLELFVESLLTKSIQITQARNAKTLTPSHMKQCILSESRFDFLKDLVKNIPDASTQDDNDSSANESADYTSYRSSEEGEHLTRQHSSHERKHSQQEQEIVANFYTEQSTSSGRTPVIQYSPKIMNVETQKVTYEPPKVNYAIEPKLHIDLRNPDNFSMAVPAPVPQLVPTDKVNKVSSTITSGSGKVSPNDNIPPLVPLNSNFYTQNVDDNLLIDEDYDN